MLDSSTLISQILRALQQQKYPNIKFDFNISNDAISFLDTKVYIYTDKNRHLQTTVYYKETDHQSFLHSKSGHQLLLKESIPFSQTLNFKQIYSTVS